MRFAAIVCLGAFLGGVGAGLSSAADQSDAQKHNARQFVDAQPLAPVQLSRVKPAVAEVRFTVRGGYHINSHTPKGEYLIPTVLTLSSDKTVLLGKAIYPAGKDITLPLAPDEKLNVYTGDFAVTVPLSAPKRAAAGSYKVSGELKYQACNDNSCFPPKTVPVEFTVVVK